MPTPRAWSRRAFLAGGCALAGTVAGAGCRSGVPRAGELPPGGSAGLGGEDRRLVNALCTAGLRYFREAAHPVTGQVLDRRLARGEPETRRVASIAATGFGLSVLAVAHEEGWDHRAPLREQVRRTLRHLATEMPHERGFFYHFHDWETGARVWRCELSSIDTAILLCGVTACRSAFGGDPEILDFAGRLLRRVEWPWMLAGGSTFSMGWRPEEGFLESRWDHYCELMLLVLLSLGSDTHPVEPAAWRAWSRPVRTYYGRTFVWSPAPLFVHQFAHAWFDFRGRADFDGTDWFRNSVAATEAHRAWCMDRADRFPLWSGTLWGVTSSDSEKGYTGWGGPPDSGPLDGTVVPCAAAGSLPMAPGLCLETLRHQRERFGARIWDRYGFVDAFNPHTGWVNPDVVGIDIGISAVMAANLRSGGLWRLMERDDGVQRGWLRAGLGGRR